MTGQSEHRSTTSLGLILERDSVQRIAIVDVGDTGGIELRQRKRRVEYTPAEAIALGRQLLDLALQTQLDERREHDAPDSEAWEAAGERFRTVPLAHGFDVAPICRECFEGKHGACTGIALVDGEDIEEHPCGCSRADHQVIGAGS